MPGPWIRTNGFMALAFSCCLCFPSATPTQQIMIDVGANSVGRACLGGESAFSIAFPQGSFADDGTVNLTAITAASDPEQYDNLIGMAAAGQDFLSVVDMSDTFFIISAQEQPLKDAIMSLGIPPSLTQPYQAASDADVRVAYINGYEDDDVELELAPGFAPFAAFLNESSLITTLAPEVFTAG
ncbi:g2153 [Coccomyxa viridis]|uniref:G2153 protein n=1 Tax=Coccomyxa viridis TaxID=1274662 RepID=A0ABP1FPW5_9CHLO